MTDRVGLVHSSLVAGLSLLAAVLLSGHAQAADQGGTGKKLLLKDKPKMVIVSKDPFVTPGANGSGSDPRCVPDGGSGSGATITLNDGTNSATLNMPCAHWSTNGPGALYTYKLFHTALNDDSSILSRQRVGHLPIRWRIG